MFPKSPRLDRYLNRGHGILLYGAKVYLINQTLEVVAWLAVVSGNLGGANKKRFGMSASVCASLLVSGNYVRAGSDYYARRVAK